MEIRNRETGALTTISQFKADHPNTSFPKQITVDILDSFGYDPVLNGVQATTTPPYEMSVRDGVEEIDGQWFTRFVVGPIFTDTTTESFDEDGNVTTISLTAAENEAAYRARIDAEASSKYRDQRNRLLAASDWTQLADSSADASAWATYRQALRDLPTTDGWPHNITWPTEPS
tara:strand:+ start:867 stop:1388 length:522 start_codon:yes stop_codon:yes gene_type:complete